MPEDEYNIEEDSLKHYGIARRSGRYPWGSGGDPYQRATMAKQYFDDMKAKGLSEKDIAKALSDYVGKPNSVRSTDIRDATAISTEYIRSENINTANRLKSMQMSNVAIAKQMGTKESTVRGWLKAYETRQESSLVTTAKRLKEEIEAKEFLEVGKGTELYMGIADTKLRAAIGMLKDEGYKLWHFTVPQLGTDKETRLRILTKEDKTWHDVKAAKDADKIGNVAIRSDDGGLTYNSPKPMPVSVSSKRIDVRYRDDGGHKMDGVIELRRGVDELSLGDKRYAQVRVAVDGTHYLKGMAMYADDLPAGVDIRFNTNKSKAEAPNKTDAMKKLKVDPDGNPLPSTQAFGATVRPKTFTDKKGKEQTSPLNIVNEEGKWDLWSKSLSSQMLSKQPLSLASQQLAKTQASRKEELDRIMKLTNPVVRKKMLEEFADSADAAAVHLKAAHMPRQSSHVILPINTMRPHEVYAPNFDTGDKVVLIRYPHGGPFEIPALTVNNRNITARRILSNARDAIGIHHSVADQLSGADFDGDSVLVIPNPSGKIKTRPPLEGLKDFDAKAIYKIPDDDTVTPRMSKKNTQTEMGKISNLITDMTIRGANDQELARAVRHSMVVIDAEKHGLNYKLSERDNGIPALKKEYQGGTRRGAATLISQASSTQRIDQVKLRQAKDGGPIDPKTGKLVWVPTGATRTRVVTKVNKRTGETYEVEKTEPLKSVGTKMGWTDDARKLSSGTPMEELYAAHANSMKAMANQARKDSLTIRDPRQSKAARAIYSKEVESLTQKLRTAQRNAPLERRAQIMGNSLAKARIDADPSLDKDDIKKIKYQSLEEARTRTGASKFKIGAPDENGNSTLLDREWEAIQAGAFSASTLREILSNADMDRVKSLATPSTRTALSPGQMARAKQMFSQGRGMSEIAAQLGIPRSTLVDNIANQ